jgi:hypothetical protein
MDKTRFLLSPKDSRREVLVRGAVYEAVKELSPEDMKNVAVSDRPSCGQEGRSQTATFSLSSGLNSFTNSS